MEGVQRRATKLITAIKDGIYEDRLRVVNLTTLETRWLRGDLNEVFKIFKGFDDLDPNIFCELSQAHTRGVMKINDIYTHQVWLIDWLIDWLRSLFKIDKTYMSFRYRKYSFAHRVTDVWNSLDESIIACDSINGFKNRIDKFVHGLRAKCWSFLPS